MTNIYEYSPTLAFYGTTKYLCGCEGFSKRGICCHQEMLNPTFQSALDGPVEQTIDFDELDLPSWYSDEDVISEASSVSFDDEKYQQIFNKHQKIKKEIFNFGSQLKPDWCVCLNFRARGMCDHVKFLHEDEEEKKLKEERINYFYNFIETLKEERKKEMIRSRTVSL